MKRIKFIIVLVFLSIFGCSEKENYLGDDIRLWKDTEAWEFAKSISKNNFEKAEEILAKGKIDVDYREPKYGQTLLFWAVWHADLDAVKFLISHGAEPNTHNTYNGDSPIAIASDYFIRSDILVYLLAHGGNPNDYVKKDEKLSYAPVNETPLIRAAFTSMEKTKILVKAGADVNFFVDNDFRNTPLLSAERRTNLDIVRTPYLARCDAKYGGITIPERGIIVGKGVFTSQIPEGTAMMQHEYGHILQYLKVGPKAYYSIIAPESLASATFTSVKSHHSFWTETWANYLSKGYFGLKWLGNKIKGYPANNISDLNLLRLRIASIPLFY